MSDSIKEKLEKIHIDKLKIKEKLNNSRLKKPFLIEIAGLSCTGKTNVANKLFEFFDEANIETLKTKTPNEILKETYSKEIQKEITNIEYTKLALSIARRNIETSFKVVKPNIIIQDTGLISNYFLLQKFLNNNKISIDEFNKKIIKLPDELSKTDRLYILHADFDELIKRNDSNHICLEQSKKIDKNELEETKKAYTSLLAKIKNPELKNKIKIIDTTNISEFETSILLANDINKEILKTLLKKKNIIRH